MENNGSQNTIAEPFEIDTSRSAVMRVLIVDDDLSLADFLRQFLEEYKFNVETASSGEEALSMIADAGEIDIALIDYRLPGIDGLETIKRISEFSPDTVTMIITGLPTLDSSIRAIRLGASNYILKPFKLDDVAVAVKKAMKEREIKSEIRKLREKIATIEKKALRSKDIDINDSVESPGDINNLHGNEKYHQSRPSSD
jgi:DNA-binding NtrC family response regulator